MFNHETMARLLAPTSPAASIFLPLMPNQRDARGVNLRLREHVGDAQTMLQRIGVDVRRCEQVLAPLHQVAAETDSADHPDPALALFTDGTFIVAEPLPREVPEMVVVAEDFHIKPLLPFLAINRHFYVQALSKTRVRLLVATPFTCQEVRWTTSHPMRRRNWTAVRRWRRALTYTWNSSCKAPSG